MYNIYGKPIHNTYAVILSDSSCTVDGSSSLITYEDDGWADASSFATWLLRTIPPYTFVYPYYMVLTIFPSTVSKCYERLRDM